MPKRRERVPNGSQAEKGTGDHMKDLRGAIFDLDGTLLDSMKIWEQIDIDFLRRRGVPPTPDYTAAVTSMDPRSAAEYTIRRYGFLDTPEMLMAEWTQMCREAYRSTVPLKPGAGEWVRSLFARGVRIAAATALSPELFLPALRRLGIAECFSAFACCGEVPRGKGVPDVYLLAAERLRLTARQCLVFEDILTGVRGAKAGGFSVCGVFDESSAQDWAKICEEADFALPSFLQAEQIIFGEK